MIKKRRRTFETEAELAAYKLGYNDGIDTTTTVLKATAVTSSLTDKRLEASLQGIAIALDESAKFVISAQ
jgi:hypothetical protein